MPKCTIAFDKTLCIGCGSCVAVAPKFWEIEDGLAVLKNMKNNQADVSDTDANALKESADTCPTEAIKFKKN